MPVRILNLLPFRTPAISMASLPEDDRRLLFMLPAPDPPLLPDGSFPVQYPHRGGWHTVRHDPALDRPSPSVPLHVCPPTRSPLLLHVCAHDAHVLAAARTRGDMLMPAALRRTRASAAHRPTSRSSTAPSPPSTATASTPATRPRPSGPTRAPPTTPFQRK